MRRIAFYSFISQRSYAGLFSFLLLILLFVSAIAGANSNSEKAGTSTLAIEVFVRQGCPHCAKAEAFLEKFANQRPDLQIDIHDVAREPEALQNLVELFKRKQLGAVRVPAFYVHDQLLVGYSDEATTGQWLRNEIAAAEREGQQAHETTGSCEAAAVETCGSSNESVQTTSPHNEIYNMDFLGFRLSLDEVGLPLFSIAMGLLDGFNPCSMWVLILMISLLAPMQDRARMLAVAGTFVVVEGLAYFLFMAAWLNLFMLIGLSRMSEIAIAGIAILAGAINLKDFWAYGRGVSLSIPQSAKPGIYQRIRRILQARNLTAAMFGAVVLAVLVQIVELFCTSGFPALYTRILTLHQLNGVSYYAYLLLYNFAYMLDDMLMLGVGVVTLSQHRLQENEGRWLKLISGLVMVGLGIYLLLIR